MVEKTTGVFIARCEPPTAAHIRNVIRSAEQVDTLNVLIGSANASRSPKNPLTYDQRVEVFQAALVRDYSYLLSKIEFFPLYDYPFNDARWASEVREAVDWYGERKDRQDKIKIFGYEKDDSSYYLKMFPDWELVELPCQLGPDGVMNATDMRRTIYNAGVGAVMDEYFFNEQHEKAIQKLAPVFESVRGTFEYDEDYKRKTRFIGLDFPPSFHCVDAVVYCAGHILMIQRKDEPGKGMWALPGGHVEVNERHIDACLRELVEETQIHLPERVLRNSVKFEKLIDTPDRSGRGRVTSVAYFIYLDPEKGFPRIYGSSDAEKAQWVPLGEIDSYECFEDHYHIIQAMVDMAQR